MAILRPQAPEGASATGAGSQQASDRVAGPDGPPRYCPTDLLATFALLMAGHARCVKTDMMLGDREYAMWQLACARAIDDAELGAVTARLFAYFDDPLHSGVVVQGTA